MTPDGPAGTTHTAPGMHAQDQAAGLLGIELLESGPGSAVTRMTVTAEMLNGLAVCHGGVVFTLADTAMAAASNSHGQVALAVTASIDLLSPGREGMVLTARASEAFRRGRTALYDVEVTADDGTLIGRFHGRTQHPVDRGNGVR